MKAHVEIPLTQGHVALVDVDDYGSVITRSWSVRDNGDRLYAQHAARTAAHRKTTRQMHRVLTGWALVDHVNGNGLDNRRENLRPATPSQNNANTRVRPGTASGFKGVTWHASSGKWLARAHLDGRVYRLGFFVDSVEAARAYDAKARELFGQFARLNFPEEQP